MVRSLASSVAGIVFGAVLMMTLVEPGRVHAAPCPDIYKLVEAGVSDKMLEQAIRASAQDITPDVATCVEQMGVSVDVVRLVRSLAKEAAASAPVAPQQSPPVSDRAQPSPSNEASSPKEQRAEAWLRTVPMQDELAAPAPSRSVSATQSVPEPTVPTGMPATIESRPLIFVRPYLGFANGPVDQRYYGQYLQATDLSGTLETYAWQATRNGSGLVYGVSVAYGILPTLQVGLTAGGGLGTFEYELQKQTEGQDPTQLPSEGEGTSTLSVGPEFLVALMPTSTFRPVFGGGVTWRRGTAIDSFVQLPPDLPSFPANNSVVTHALVGGEVRVSDSLDLFVHLPITMMVGGTSTRQQYDGNGLMARNTSPTAPGAIGAGLHAGVQFRIWRFRNQR